MNIASSADSKNAFLFLIDIFFEFILYFKFLSLYSSIVHIIFAGLPATTTQAGTLLVTTEPAAIKTLSLIVTPGIIKELAPIYT